MTVQEQIVVWDIEYTSWEGCLENGWDPKKNQYREIIQLGAIILNTKTAAVEKELLLYVKPQKNPVLSEYITKLTGITQEEVDKGIIFQKALEQFLEFTGTLTAYSFNQDWHVVVENASLFNVLLPNNSQFIDAKDVFHEQGISTQGYNSSTMLEYFGETNEDQHHDALGDAKALGRALYRVSQGKEK